MCDQFCSATYVQQSVAMAGFDPRLEDMSAVKQLYESIFKPYISSASSWVSEVSVCCDISSLDSALVHFATFTLTTLLHAKVTCMYTPKQP